MLAQKNAFAAQPKFHTDPQDSTISKENDSLNEKVKKLNGEIQSLKSVNNQIDEASAEGGEKQINSLKGQLKS
jgi:uncharacterized protein YlxW (UPF0749 family)